MKPSADSDCKRCGGSGFVKVAPSERYPNGAYAICTCRKRIQSRQRLAKLMTLSGLTPEALRRWSFDSFSVKGAQTDAAGKAQLAKVKALCQAYAQDPKGWLVLCGPFGCGKTHLAYAAAGAYYGERGTAYVSTVPDLLEALRQGYSGKGGSAGFEKRFSLVCRADLLVLDDLGAQNDTPWAAEKLYQIIDYRYRERLPMIVTTNVNLYEPKGRIEPRVLSRILDGANTPDGFSRVVLLRARDYRRRAARMTS